MESASYWLVFFTAALAINISPGPDLLYILTRTIAQGRKIGIACAAGLWTGAMVHVSAAALGLSAILAASAAAFNTVKFAGAAYLIYLGIQAFRGNGVNGFPETLQENGGQAGAFKAFRQGAMVDLLNPKVAVFFMAFLPQFIRPELGHSSIQIFILGSLVIVVAIPVELFVVFTAAGTTGFFRNNPRFAGLLDRLSGTVLIGLGIRLALSVRHNA